jgi:hypothetical protein
MTKVQQYNHRNRIKLACLAYAVEQGLSPGEMVLCFRQAAEKVRMQKSAELDISSLNAGNLLPAIVKSPLTWGLLGGGLLAPLVMGPGGRIGYTVGQMAQSAQHGRTPSPSEVQEVDMAIQYLRQAEEIEKRMTRNEAKKKEKSVPSVRRMF